MAKYSIILPAYKKYNQIKCFLYSILSQTYQNFEVIVIHDGYDTEHRDVMTEFLKDERFIYFQTPIRYNDWGMTIRNIGMSIASGDFILNTNDDNYYVPVFLENIENEINNNPNINFVYYDMVHNYNMPKNKNRRDYGLFVPELKVEGIDIGQFVVKSELIKNRKFQSTPIADGLIVEEMLSELKPSYVNKILFIHN